MIDPSPTLPSPPLGKWRLRSTSVDETLSWVQMLQRYQSLGPTDVSRNVPSRPAATASNASGASPRSIHKLIEEKNAAKGRAEARSTGSGSGGGGGGHSGSGGGGGGGGGGSADSGPTGSITRAQEEAHARQMREQEAKYRRQIEELEQRSASTQVETAAAAELMVREYMNNVFKKGSEMAVEHAECPISFQPLHRYAVGVFVDENGRRVSEHYYNLKVGDTCTRRAGHH